MVSKKFYLCGSCNSILVSLNGEVKGCCSEDIKELVPNSSGAAVEKHMPVVTVSGNRVDVNVGEVEHPMTDEHLISSVYLETKKGGQFKNLTSSHKPKVSFLLEDDEPVAVYEYCNLHGLWKKEL